MRALEPFESDFNGPLKTSKVLARGDVTDEERLLASQKAEDRGLEIEPELQRDRFGKAMCSEREVQP